MPTNKKKADAKLAHRMFAARNQLERQLGRDVTLEELGIEVAKTMGLSEPIAGSVVARWIKGLQDPRSRRQWFALATTLRVDPGWLAFGTASLAPAPEGYKELEEEQPATKRRRAG